MDLSHLTDQPQLRLTICGRAYRFSELPLEALGRLQEWLKANHKHPLDDIKPHLSGLSDTDRAAVLEAARKEGRNWPPQIGTAAGSAALLSSEPGQVEAVYEGLLVHQPELSREAAARVYRQLRKEAGAAAKAAKRAGREYDGEGTAHRIFAVLFGLDDPSDEYDLPKG
jgi:hypothetical protein